MLLLAAGITSCAQDKLDTSTSGKSIDEVFNQKGEAYMTVNIALPSTAQAAPLGRADASFQDGVPSEYAVDRENSYLILFSGAEDADPTAKSVYKLSALGTWNNDTEDQITVNNKFVQQITRAGMEGTDNIYAYVLLNAKGFSYTANTDGDLSKNKLALVNGTYIVDNVSSTKVNMKFSDFMKLTQTTSETKYPTTANNPFITDGEYFFMSNAALSTFTGADTYDDPQILAKVTTNNIKPSENAAIAAGAAVTVSVERAVAKVTLSKGGSAKIAANTLSNEADMNFDIVGWQIVNDSKTSYIGKQLNADASQKFTGATAANTNADQGVFQHYSKYVSGSSNVNTYRFIETVPVKSDESYYRIRWAVSPTYKTEYNANSLLKGFSDNILTNMTWVNTNTPIYPLENTTDVAHMTQQQMTAVQIKIQPKEDAASELTNNGFFTSSADPNKVLELADLNTIVKEYILNTKSLQALSELLAVSDGDYAYPGTADATKFNTWRNKWTTLLTGFITNPADATAFYKTDATALHKTNLQYSFKGQKFGQLGKYNNGSSDVYMWSAKPDAMISVATISDVDDLKNDQILTGTITLEATNAPNIGSDLAYATQSSEANTYKDVTGLLKAYVTAAITNLCNADSPTYNFYKNGVMYYNGFIQHFGKTEAPWNDAEWGSDTSLKPSATAIYPIKSGADYQGKNYLGRWGVVRNNWYDLQVNSVRKIGSPVPESPTSDQPIDNINEYFMMTVRILPWAKHATQGLDL